MSETNRARWAAQVPWDGIQDKPAAFDRPDGSIQISDVEGLQQALAGKANAGSEFSGNYNDLTNKPALGSAAFANTTDFYPADTPRRFQTAEFTLIAGVQAYDVEFSQEMFGPPAVHVQCLADGTGLIDGTGQEMFYAVVQRDTITATGFRLWISIMPTESANGIRWWARYEVGFGGTVAPYPPPVPFEPETEVWIAGIEAAGGTFELDSKTIADDLVIALKATAYYSKIKYLMPLLGADIIAARMPLIDTLAVGIAGNSGFVDADFDQAVGLQGDGSKWMDTLIKASDLDPGTNNAGFGFWNLSVGTLPWCFASNGAGGAGGLYGLALWDADELFYYGNAGTDTRTNVTSQIAHYYGQRVSATDRRLYRDATEIAMTAVNDVGAGSNYANIFLMALSASSISESLCGCAYLTDGFLSPTEITDLHTLLQTWLMTPTGRP